MISSAGLFRENEASCASSCLISSISCWTGLLIEVVHGMDMACLKSSYSLLSCARLTRVSCIAGGGGNSCKLWRRRPWDDELGLKCFLEGGLAE